MTSSFRSTEEQMDRLKGKHIEMGWGNQIRSYVLQPYQMVKDLRTEYEVGDPQTVLDGNLDGFMEAWLKARVGESDDVLRLNVKTPRQHTVSGRFDI